MCNQDTCVYFNGPPSVVIGNNRNQCDEGVTSKWHCSKKARQGFHKVESLPDSAATLNPLIPLKVIAASIRQDVASSRGPNPQALMPRN